MGAALESVLERVVEEMTLSQQNKREDIVKGMKKSKADFKKRYGAKWKNVMYATATKLATEEVVEEGVVLKNEGYGYHGTIDKEHEDKFSEVVKHVKDALTKAHEINLRNDKHTAEVTGKETPGMKRRAGLKISDKTVGHYLDSVHGRHFANAMNYHKDAAKAATEHKKSMTAFLRDYHPTQFD